MFCQNGKGSLLFCHCVYGMWAIQILFGAKVPLPTVVPLLNDHWEQSHFGLSHWDPYAVRRGGCLELYYCNMVEWFWWDSSLILMTNWFPSVLWHCWFGHLARKNRPQNDLLCVEWDVKPYTLTHSLCWPSSLSETLWFYVFTIIMLFCHFLCTVMFVCSAVCWLDYVIVICCTSIL